MRVYLLTIPILILTLSFAACGRKDEAAPKVTAAAATLPSSLFLGVAPADAKDIKDAKPSLKQGDKVVLTGRIGGSKEPFVAGRAVFTIVDQRVKSCGPGSPMPDCKTPWDYCCEDEDVLTSNMATVQVVGAGGQPIKAGLDGVHGLKPLALVTIVGTVAQAEKGNLLVLADGIYIGE